ncbi:LysM peptidoglycan-binding domain-containing protein [Salinicoccus halitifaciens]|uniref:LysM repeat protein n=1 Tax=Salinicoccus halitifaciens TaxID=1073415 RepID=A0ABV2E6F4_9STAP|nr:LysM peptidoglycan-binding domain-containing protein [Salinicoccus halitifaciens]MCD2136949.1 LysM peptidoglycan-binding domain-containing protein [Salinicoccus halitifaciens]
MKDDFYKDMKHKRTQNDTEHSKVKHKNKDKKDKAKVDEKSREEESLKRSAKYKDRTNEPSNQLYDKVKVYFNRENLEKGKAFFAGKLSTYNERFSNELKVTKEKLDEFRNRPKKQKTAGQDGVDDGESARNKGLLPMIAAGIIIVPLTLFLGFVIINNFWPSNDGMELATDEAETEEAAEPEDEELNEDLEEQRFEMERRMAESRGSEEDGAESESEEEETSESGEAAVEEGDLASENVEANYSGEELSILEDIAGDAIDEKESGDEAEVPSESAEEAEEAQDEGEEAEETESAGTTHTVTAEDNLYQIALRYYGSGAPEDVQRIRDANGISGNAISEGQELIIP